MQEKSKVIIAATGGLGNQLFQVAAALSFSKLSPISIDQNLFNNSNKDIFDFIPAQRVKIVPFKEVGWVNRKLANGLLRASRGTKSAHPKDWSPNKYRRVASYLLNKRYCKDYEVFSPSEIGFDPNFQLRDQGALLIGYFQSYKWFESSKVKELFGLQETSKSKAFETLKKSAEISKPIILHVRLGDYVSSKDLGILPAKYYKEALSKLRPVLNKDEVWVFSNETIKVEEFLPRESGYKFKVIDTELTPAQTLELMRYGSAYIIGNSTFSWWAAFLKYDRNARVFYPSTWFRQINRANMMHPIDWEALEI
ncbi:Fut1_Fut2_like domain containing protein [Candidatus Nanopelagicaceae bacterium]